MMRPVPRAEGKTCAWCSTSFEITPEDRAFYEKVSPVFNGKKELIPPPTLCPDCRQQRRLSWRNERNLYHRKCDLTGRQIISIYAPDSPQKVYDQDAFWGDKWDAITYGSTYDFSRPFFEQFADLFLAVPRISLINKDHENSEYCNFSLQNKNSYLLFTCYGCEDSFYCNRSQVSRSICDCANVEDCELCYEVIDSDRCYHCQYLQNCSNCSDCFLGYNLRGCRDCFACYNLQKAQYQIGNAQYTKEGYEELMPKLLKDMKNVRRNFEERKREMPHKYMDCINVENCTGNAIINSRNARACYEVIGVQDCTYVANATSMKDAFDVNNDDRSELVYEAVGSEANTMHCFDDICWFDHDILYCSLCFHCNYCFGCTGLKHKKYCILNKQYTKEEYEALLPKIIAHMRQMGEWGEFFPTKYSPFSYNETMAQDFFPLSAGEVTERGWKWRMDNKQQSYLGPETAVPDSIEGTDDSLCNKILRCSVTGKPYKIIPKEFVFYRQMGIPPPKKCFEQRMIERMQLRNPRKLWSRKCAKCGKVIETTYNPERPEIVYCESCYLATTY
ncbi:MAG: hypothetical protein PHH13_02945 [Candidatus Peribacteraceae bacterium]|nr:hypothetical protein [Candidatus Peribacteraceae bacterium]